MKSNRTLTVASLGTAQTLAWASSYYLPAILAVPMARDLGVSTPTVFAAFSVALVVSALLGPAHGLRGLGRPASAAGAAAELESAVHTGRSRASGNCRPGQVRSCGCASPAARPKRHPHLGAAGAGVCLHLVHQHSHGRPPAAIAAVGWRSAGHSPCFCRAGRSGTGGRPAAGIRTAAAHSPAGVGPAGRRHAHAGRGGFSGLRRTGGGRCSRCCTAPAMAC